MQKRKILPTFQFEKPLWNKEYFVFGVDEVGRGAVAGPVVAGAVLLKDIRNEERAMGFGIDDSKRLTKKRREDLIPIIKRYFYRGIGEVDSGTINNLGIQRATRLAIKRSIKNLEFSILNLGLPKKRIFLIDGRYFKGIGRQKAIIKGDQKSISIAAASIIAKVYRDDLMKELGNKYIHYGFNRHVGYGTKLHRLMIEKYGMCYLHREQFVKTLLSKKTFENNR
jgi:ribonuclease HII